MSKTWWVSLHTFGCKAGLYGVGLKTPLSSYRASVSNTSCLSTTFPYPGDREKGGDGGGRGLTEKSIRQRNRINILHSRILRKIRINKKEYRHIHRLARIQFLFLKAETLDLTKIRCYLSRRNAVGCNTNYVVGSFVGGCIESQGGFAR